MKKLAIMSITFLFAFAGLQLQAQDAEKAAIKATKKEVKAEKKELKIERIALRKLEGTDVSPISQTNFNADFGAVTNAVWKRSKTFDEVTFVKEGKKETAFYDSDSKLVGSTSVITFDEVPAKGQKEILKKYKDYTTGPVVFFNDNEANETEMLLWGIQFDDEDNYFVELKKANEKIIVRVDSKGNVFFFKQL
jgi:hypothetical protein